MTIIFTTKKLFMISILNFILIFWLCEQNLNANVLADFSKILHERKQFILSSKNVLSGVKALYRERKSIAEFARSANVLIQAYKGLQGKADVNSIPKLIEIANAITNLVKEYNNLAPKTAKIYSQIKPDLDYLSTYKTVYEKVEDVNNKILIKTVPESRINSIAIANGLNRVWDTIKNNPLSIFKWGRLKDEFTYGKLEAQYALKAAQIAFETEAYLESINKLMNDLISIKNEINQIVNGNIISLIGIGNTINKILSSAATVEKISILSSASLNNLQKRFNEFINLQQDYLNFHQKYMRKYYPQYTSYRNEGYKAYESNSNNINIGTQSSISKFSVSNNNLEINDFQQLDQTSNNASNLQDAMEMYQKAYRDYIKVMQNPHTSDEERKQAIYNLQNLKRLVEQLKLNKK